VTKYFNKKSADLLFVAVKYIFIDGIYESCHSFFTRELEELEGFSFWFVVVVVVVVVVKKGISQTKPEMPPPYLLRSHK
jgi:hypothetical protein